MSKNFLETSNKVLLEYMDFMENKTLPWYEQLHAVYPWIFPQLEQLKNILEEYSELPCSASVKNREKQEAKQCLEIFVFKLQNLYLAAVQVRKLPAEYKRKRYEPLAEFYERFLQVYSENSMVLAAGYIADLPPLKEVQAALAQFKKYSSVSLLSRERYNMISALSRALHAFLPVVKQFQVSEEKLLKHN